MAIQLGALRDALLDGGTSPESAARAAEEVAGYENGLASTDASLAVLRWPTEANAAVTAGVLWTVLTL